ncbi:hypothetical protein HDU87_000057 [Geranomyces variabilis]|uniref:Tail specific protease domain-containing protein n=1 Tax=Geranomyces variabilis TaxID=109894 RepID=A0AAD5TS85_9FUNG|nr:hypothetical protein HDU87_000057 [Geranomyces variabilis]
MHVKLAAAAGLLAVFGRAQAAPHTDFCQLVAKAAQETTGWINVDQVVGCLSTFPLDEKIRKSTLDTLSKTFEGEYAFTDMATTASTIDGGKWTLQNVDLRKFIKKAATKKYANEKSFFDDINATMRLLGDAHTGFRHSCHHSEFSFYQPWGFDVLFDPKTGKNFVKLAAEDPTSPSLGAAVPADLYAKVAKAIGRDPKTLRGWKVLLIDGKDAVDFIKSVADTDYGVAKDGQTRFNRAAGFLYVGNDGSVTKGFGPASLRSNLETPANASRTLKLQSPDGKQELVVVVPWFARRKLRTPIPYKDAPSFYKNVCLAQKDSLQKRGLSVQTGKGFQHDAKEFLVALDQSQPHSFPNNTENYFGNGYPHLVKKGDFASFMMLDAETAVSTLPTFSSDAADGPFGPTATACRATLADKDVTANIGTGGPAGWRFYCFIKEIHDGLHTLKAQGAKRIILDWTGNGGGWGDLGFAHAAVMFPQVVRDQARFRLSPLMEQLIGKAFALDRNLTTPNTMFGPANFLDPKTQKAPLASDVQRLFTDPKAGRNETFGGYTSRYSNLINIVDGGGIFDASQKHNVWDAIGAKKPTEPIWPKENVMLLTEGYCGSTCAHAARVLVDEVGIRSTVKGGLAGSKPFTFSAFPGGNVLDIDQLFSDPQKIDMADNPLTPQPFLAAVSMFRVNVGVGYSHRKDLPAEYAYSPANCRLDITEDNVFPAMTWKAAAATFKGCGGDKPSYPGYPTNEPNYPGNPADPTNPTEPTYPGNPTDPTNPTKPTYPGNNPSDPDEPTYPGPTDPTEPSYPPHKPGKCHKKAAN